MANKVLAGRYELFERIGEGGMSVVYKAKDKLLNRFVAIKILKPQFIGDHKFIDSFRRESQAAASMSHPNIVNIYDVSVRDNIKYIVMEYIHGKIKAKTLFATHYHQLIALEDELSGVKNYSVAVKERGNDIVFLRRIIAGGTDRSYGVHVARLAGLPKKVLDRANEILQEYDRCESGLYPVKQASVVEEAPQMMGSLFSSGLADQILKLDVMSMTPIEAMNALYKLQEEARKESGR